MKLKPPKTVKQIWRFCGVINFIKNFIPNHADILAPITNLTKKDVPFKWSTKEQNTFKAIKAAVSDSILCAFPQPGKRYIIYPDAYQKYAMAALLMQVQQGKEVCISTFSKKFNDVQLLYPVGKQELLAAHEACWHFHQFIFGEDVLIKTDHKNLVCDNMPPANLINLNFENK